MLHGEHAFDYRRHDGFSFVVLALQILLGELPYGEEASESAASSSTASRRSEEEHCVAATPRLAR